MSNLKTFLDLNKLPQIIRATEPNPYDYVGTMLVNGKTASLKRFLIEVCHYHLLKGSNTFPLKERWYRVKGSKQAFIRTITSYDLPDTEEDNTVLFLYKQAYDIYVEHLVKISQRYNTNFRLFAIDDCMVSCRNIEVIGGQITKNEFWLPEDDDPRIWPDIYFGDPAMRNQRAYRGECTLSSNISAELSEILKAVADEQGKRFIETCPCCGRHEMFTYNGKTDGWPSSQAGVYICDHCGCKESEESIPALSKWAVFKKENAHVFFAEDNGKH